MRLRFNTTLENHLNNHTNSKLTFTPKYPEFGIEVRYINEIIKKISVIYANLINQYKFKNQTVFLPRFGTQDEDNQALDETELFVTLNINHNLTAKDNDNIDVKSPLERQIQQQEMKDSGWQFDKSNSMTLFFYKLV